MRRILCLTLVLALMCGFCPAAGAEDFLAPVKEHPDVFALLNPESPDGGLYQGGNAAGIITRFPNTDFQFDMPGGGYGYGRFTLIFDGLHEKTPVCWPSFMVTLVIPQPLNAHTIIFPLEEGVYTFECAMSGAILEDGYAVEMLHIVFDGKSLPFIKTLGRYYHSVGDDEEMADALPLDMIIRGDQEVHIRMEEPIMMDYWALFEGCLDLLLDAERYIPQDGGMMMTTEDYDSFIRQNTEKNGDTAGE